MKLRVWFLETRPQFLLLSLVLAFLGTSIAWRDGAFNFGHALLAFFGLLLAHISVNVLNDYFDYRSGIDLETRRTPFSGGSGILPARLMEPKGALRFGLGAFLLTIPIGIYFVVARGWPLLPLLLIAAACILLYTPIILKTRWPELAAGIGLGSLPILGAFFVQTSDYTFAAVIASVPSGILVHNLLLLNEFPDIEPDRKAGRKTLPIALGTRGAGIFYIALEVLVYVWIVGAVIARIMPVFALLALLTVPFAVQAIRGALKPQEASRLMPGLGGNVLAVLLTQFLLGIGYILAAAFS